MSEIGKQPGNVFNGITDPACIDPYISVGIDMEEELSGGRFVPDRADSIKVRELAQALAKANDGNSAVDNLGTDDVDTESGDEKQNAISIIGTLIDTQYGPCSIAAAQLCMEVTGLMQAKRVGTHVHSGNFVDSPFPRVADYIFENAVKVDAYGRREYTNHPVRRLDNLTFIQLLQSFQQGSMRNPHEAGILEMMKGRRQKVSKKLTAPTKLVRDEDGIMLVESMLDGRLMLPIATFQSRPESNTCSYVQLGGKEIYDDESVFATQADEQQDSRLAIIDAIRKLVGAQIYRSGISESDLERDIGIDAINQIRNFAGMVRREEARKIAEALSPFFSEWVKELLSQYGIHSGTMTIIDENGNKESINPVQRAGLYQTGLDVDGSKLSLEIIKPENGANNEIAYLAWVARSRVAIPIAEIFLDTGETRVMVEKNHQITGLDHYGTVIAGISAVTKKLDSTDTRSSMSNNGGFYYDLLNYLAISGHNEFGTVTDRMDPHPSEVLLTINDITERLRRALRPVDAKQELLAKAICEIPAGKVYAGRIDGIKIGRTTGTIDGEIELIEGEDGMVELPIRIKPTAMIGAEIREIARLKFDPSEPLGDSLPSGDDALEFYNIVRAFNTVVSK